MRGIKPVIKTNKRGTFIVKNSRSLDSEKYIIGEIYESNKNEYKFYKYDDFPFAYDEFKVGDSQTVYLEVEVDDVNITDYNYYYKSNNMKIIRKIPKKEWKKWIKYDGNNSNIDNVGYQNSGSSNFGDKNSGNNNLGYYNSGNFNVGNLNRGDYNFGDKNSGNNNFGDNNSGDYNIGNSNIGSYNKGHFNVGMFNDVNGLDNGFLLFNKPFDEDMWECVLLPGFITSKFNPKISYTQNWMNIYNKLLKSPDCDYQISLLKNIPNFNSLIFQNITGLKIF